MRNSRVLLVMLTGLCLPGSVVAVTDDVIDSFLYYSTACPGYANAVWADIDGIDNGGPTSPYETMVVFTTLTGGHANVDTSYGKKYYFSPIGCGATRPYDRIRLKIHFVDMLAPGFNQQNPATWVHRSVNAVSLEATSDYIPATQYSPAGLQVLAYTELGQTGIVQPLDPNPCPGRYFTHPDGIKEIYIASDFAENNLDNLYIDGSPPDEEFIVDNGDKGTGPYGKWRLATASDTYGPDCMIADSPPGPWDPCPSYRFEARVSRRYNYDVYLWWSAAPERNDHVNVGVYSGDEKVGEVVVNQQTNGGRWNLLGNYTFPCDTATVGIGQCTVGLCADAVRFVARGSSSCPTADFTGDCLVNLEDLAMLASEWMSSGGPCPTADLTGDCAVRFEDLAVLARQWMSSR